MNGSVETELPRMSILSRYLENMKYQRDELVEEGWRWSCVGGALLTIVHPDKIG